MKQLVENTMATINQSRGEMAAQHSMDEMASDINHAVTRIMDDASPAVLRLYATPGQLKRDLLAQLIRSMRPVRVAA